MLQELHTVQAAPVLPCGHPFLPLQCMGTTSPHPHALPPPTSLGAAPDSPSAPHAAVLPCPLMPGESQGHTLTLHRLRGLQAISWIALLLGMVYPF